MLALDVQYLFRQEVPELSACDTVVMDMRVFKLDVVGDSRPVSLTAEDVAQGQPGVIRPTVVIMD